MEEVDKFKHLGSVMCKHGGTDRDMRQGTAMKKGDRVFGHIMTGRSVRTEVKRDLRNTVIVPSITCGSKTWAWNESQRSRVKAVEMSYLRSACGVSRMNVMSKV